MLNVLKRWHTGILSPQSLRVQTFLALPRASLNVAAFPEKIHNHREEKKKNQSKHAFSTEDFSLACWQCPSMNSETYLIRSLSGCVQVFTSSDSGKSRPTHTRQRCEFLMFVFHWLSHPYHLKKTKVMKILF